MNVKRNLGTILVALVTALLTVIIYSSLTDQGEQQQSTPVSFSRQSTGDTNGLHYANLPADFEAEQFNFTLAAENTVHAVVHVKTQFTRESQFNHPFYEFFFGDRQRPEREVEGYGSGVILSSDGYIVTNHHVVKRSDELSVTLNDERSFEAEIVGTDPATDLALLKIDAEDLPHLKFGDSRDMKLGEWVLAVGNPFNIGTTVTAGIVSAKGRSIGILNSQESQLAIESFIQTDAAVNKGNSGGALVNVEGELIGINAAIASPTGSYSGYSFAIPAEIAKKVVEDLIKYGEVQRAVLGVEMVPMERAREQFDLEVRKGAFVYGVKRDGAAERAGIKPHDVIIAIENEDIASASDLQRIINSYRPGDEATITVNRDGKEKQFDVTLRNKQGSTEIITGQEAIKELGAELKALEETGREYRIDKGVQVVKLQEGKLQESGIREGFIITHVNGNRIGSVQQIKNIYNQTPAGKTLEFEGLYPGGEYVYVYQVKK